MGVEEMGAGQEEGEEEELGERESIEEMARTEVEAAARVSEREGIGVLARGGIKARIHSTLPHSSCPQKDTYVSLPLKRNPPQARSRSPLLGRRLRNTSESAGASKRKKEGRGRQGKREKKMPPNTFFYIRSCRLFGG